MKQYKSREIINLVVAGHSGSGKTSLVESMLFLSGKINKMGRADQGNTVSDYDQEEIKRKVSLTSTVIPIEWKEYKINVIDVPGLFDFEGSECEAMRVAETALITVSGKDGVCVGTEKAVKMAQKNGLSKIFFVNGLCDESSRFYRVFENLKAKFGPAVCPLVVPFIVDGKAECYVNVLENKAYSYESGERKEVAVPDMGDRLEGLRTAINEAVAETSEDMFEKYFSGEDFTPEEVILGINKGVKEGTIYPVFCGDAINAYGIEQLLDGIKWLSPTAQSKSAEIAVDKDGEMVEVSIDESKDPSIFVFKTVIDPFIGKLSYFKVMTGKVSVDTTLINMRTGQVEKIGKLLSTYGKKQEDIKYVVAGDIAAACKLGLVNTGDTLCSQRNMVKYDGIEYPKACYSKAIITKKKGDEDKLTQIILKICEEDKTLELNNNSQTHQMILSGLGEQHLDVVVSKLKNRFSIDVELEDPEISYKETIRKKVKVQGRYKKQTGGHGQYGDVWIEFEPSKEDGLEFCETVVGGAVPKGYFPAVEKGLQEAMNKGPIAGYPVVGLKATLYDGSYHPVDSSEMAFKMAASVAYREGLPKADPVLLEPISAVEIIVPDNNLGDIMGEITKRRGKVLGMEAFEEGYQKIVCELPIAEMSDFSTFIKKSTQGRGTYNFEFKKYDIVPDHIAKEIKEKK